MNRFRDFAYKVSQNNTKTVWVLKCDVKKFFASIDQAILTRIMRDYIPDRDIVWLVSQIVGSFHATRPGVGLPLGNLTSQLLVNVYLNEFDQFVKHRLKVKYYIRYADDFVVISRNKEWLQTVTHQVRDFLWLRLCLELHPKKVSIKSLASGVDFLGWVHFPDHRVLRTSTKRRMLARIAASPTPATIHSYRGLLGHGNGQKLTQRMALFEIPC